MKATTVKEVLIATKWILEHKGWCQGNYVQDKHGQECLWSSKEMAQFCLGGALAMVETEYSLNWRAEQLLASLAGGESRVIECWNDKPGRTKKQVLALLDKAIKEAE